MVLVQVHFHRTPTSEWTLSQAYLSKRAKRRIGLSATPIVNRPLDLAGICTALNAPEYLQSKGYWCTDSHHRQLDPRALVAFRKYLDRVDEAVLDLPPIHHTSHTFNTGLQPDDIRTYNSLLLDAKRLKLDLDRRKTASIQEISKLMSYLSRLQQLIVSPLLAEKGAEKFGLEEANYRLAANEHTGALRALEAHILDLRSKGQKRIIVAANHVAILKIGMTYISKRVDAAIVIYDGTLSLARRQVEKNRFLTADNSILFLSISAGGTGLHLVPGCSAMIFWGSRPYSPSIVHQCSKRIHRIGQHHEVFIRHLIADGSIDSAISLLHEDKARLSSAVLDGDFSSFETDVDGNAVLTWKKTGRVVDAATTINEAGAFRTRVEDELYIATLLQSSHVQQRTELEEAAAHEKAIEEEMTQLGEKECAAKKSAAPSASDDSDDQLSVKRQKLAAE